MSQRWYVNAVMPVMRIMFGIVLLLQVDAYAAEQRVALVIGNDAYPTAPLRNPGNDARAVARALRQVGFQVMLRNNLNLQGMVEALREFSGRLKEGDVALFYYSGHGMQVRGRNFLIPVSADIRAEDEVPYLSLDVAQVLDKLEATKTRFNFVILDACRNNPYIRTFRSARVGLAQMDAPGGTLIAFSTAPGSAARDGEGDLGTYTSHLVAHLTTPALPVEIMFRRVREGVTAETKDRQIPWESSSLKGDFSFNSAVVKPAAAAPAAAPVAAPARVQPDLAVELAFWDSVKNSTNRADFDEYLQQFPNGRFAGLARNRLRALPPETPAVPQQAETKDADRERTQLAKALDDERRERASDADAVRREMETLRAELARSREQSAAAPAQLALASPTTARAPVAQAGDWNSRIAELEKVRGKLTFAKALAILLDISAGEGLNLLVASEQQFASRNWQNAHALGVDGRGYLIWGGGFGWRLPIHATDTAQEYCARGAGDNCQVVMVNGEFREAAFLEVARRLGAIPPAEVREAYLASLRAPSLPIKLMAEGGGGARNTDSYAYASVRNATAVAAPVRARASAAYAGVWRERFESVDKAADLTLARAMSLLLDLPAGETGFAEFEKELKSMGWQSAFAIGVDAAGHIAWGGSYGWTRGQHALDSAREYCERASGDTCRVVMVNGELRSKELIDALRQLGALSPADVRSAGLEMLRNRPPPFVASPMGGSGAGTQSPVPSYGFSSYRAAQSAENVVTAERTYAAEWAPRIAALDKSGPGLTLARGYAVLFDLDAGAMPGFAEHEKEIQSRAWHSAHAVGVDRNGHLIWGGSYGWSRQQFAIDSALEFCKREAGDQCRVVFVNGEFRAREFIEAMKPLGAQPVAAVREQGRERMTRRPQPFIASATGGGTAGNQTQVPAWGYMSLR